MTMTKGSRILCCAAGFACIMFAQPVAAQDTVVQAQTAKSAVYQARIGFADLNLQSEAGARQLYSRVWAASALVCQSRDGTSALLAQASQCRRATNDVAKPAVAAVIQRARTGLDFASSLTLRIGPAKS
jgi:UrcA family protein